MTESDKMPVMADVARAANVSHQTVSRVVNGHPNVRGETKRRVEQAIKSLGYRRNSAARALVTRHSRMLGVVSFDTTLYGPASTVLGIERAARDEGYFITIVSLKKVTRASVLEALDHLSEQGVDGIVALAPHRAAARALSNVRTGVPVVAVECSGVRGVPAVSVDQMAGARLVVEHLLDLGHETVWHMTGPPGWHEAEGREAGWRAALADAERPIPDPVRGDWSPRAGFAAGAQLARSEGLTAVFVANDQMALGMLRSLAEQGIDVPAQVSVAGFDDIPESQYFSPPLTTIRQDFGAVGKSCIDLLMGQLETGAGAPSGAVVAPQLEVRASTGPAGPGLSA